MKSPIKYFGGKTYLAPKIVKLMPPHIHYVEPYAGGLSVLFAKNPIGVSEVINDINKDVTNFWQVMQQEKLFNLFKRKVENMPFSDFEFAKAKRAAHTNNVDRAAAFFVRCRQSMAGRQKVWSPTTKTRTRRGMNDNVSGYLSAIDGLSDVHSRLKRVVICTCDALECIRSQDSTNTLFYLDPPYLHETRTNTNDYACEMSEDEHESLLIELGHIGGKAMISGYPSKLYDKYLNKWNKQIFSISNHAATNDKKRIMQVCVWMNF